jgi:hypothetical protein
MAISHGFTLGFQRAISDAEFGLSMCVGPAACAGWLSAPAVAGSCVSFSDKSLLLWLFPRSSCRWAGEVQSLE